MFEFFTIYNIKLYLRCTDIIQVIIIGRKVDDGKGRMLVAERARIINIHTRTLIF